MWFCQQPFDYLELSLEPGAECLLMALKEEKCGGGQSPEETFLLPLCQASWLMETASFHRLQRDSFRLLLISALLSAPYTGQCWVRQWSHHRNDMASIYWPPNCVSLSWNKFELSYYGASDLVIGFWETLKCFKWNLFLGSNPVPIVAYGNFAIGL